MEYFRKTPIQRRSKEIVSSIMEATTHLLIEEKNPDFSTNSVAKKAGVSIGSLYQYFTDKTSIFFGLIDREILLQENTFVDYFNSNDHLALEDFLDGLLELFLKTLDHQSHAKAVFFKYAQPEMMKQIRLLENRIQILLEEKLLRHARELEGHNPTILSFILVHSTIAVCRRVLIEENLDSLEEIKKELGALYKAHLFKKS